MVVDNSESVLRRLTALSGISGTNEPSEAEELMRGFRKLEAKKLRHLRHVDQEEAEDIYAATAVVATGRDQMTQVEMSFIAGRPEEGTSAIVPRRRTYTEEV